MIPGESRHRGGKTIFVEKNRRRTVVGSGTLANAGVEVAPTVVKFPMCDAAVRKIEVGQWDLADAILAECADPGEVGVRNGSQAKMEEMREEIAKNCGVDLSSVRIRKLRKVASVFPPERRRPGVTMEGHLEAGNPAALDALIASMRPGATLTREYIRQQKHPERKGEQVQLKAERRHQTDAQRVALQRICRQLEVEKDEREQRYIDVCRKLGQAPEAFSPPLAPADEQCPNVTEDLAQGLRRLLLSRGFDPAAGNIMRAIADFVNAVVAPA